MADRHATQAMNRRGAVTRGARLYPLVKHTVFRAVAAEAHRIGTKPDKVAAQILTWWYEDCLAADAKAKSQAKVATPRP